VTAERGLGERPPTEYDRIIEENARFADAFDRSALTAAPLTGLAILTCMDARIEVEDALGLRAGDAHIIRNAGALASDDAIRSIVVSQELHQLSEETNSQFQKMKLDYYYNDPNNPERIYFRSDHWNYAKHGIPIIFYFDGTSVDYHRPTDTIEKIDFTKMTKVARLVFETGWRIANLDHRLANSH